MILRYDGSENGFFTACYTSYKNGVLPTRILRGSNATAPKKQIWEIQTDSEKANAFRALLRGVSPTALGEIALALRRLQDGVPLTVMQYAFALLSGKNQGKLLQKNTPSAFTQSLQMVKLELYRYGGILSFSQKNGGFYATCAPLDDIVDLLLISASRQYSQPLFITDEKRKKTVLWQGEHFIISHQGKEVLCEENATFSTLIDYLTPKKTPPKVTQLCLFSPPEEYPENKSYSTLCGTFYPVKKERFL